MKRIVCWTFVACVIGACSAGSKAAPGKYNEACTETMACGTGLECVGGQCSMKCMSIAQCQSLSKAGTCTSSGYCYDECQDKINCPNGLDCVMAGQAQGTCRSSTAK
jgi:hypothetical protein